MQFTNIKFTEMNLHKLNWPKRNLSKFTIAITITIYITKTET